MMCERSSLSGFALFEGFKHLPFSLSLLSLRESEAGVLCIQLHPASRGKRVPRRVKGHRDDPRCEDSLKAAVHETVIANDNNSNIAVAVDGTWHKRGYSLLNGVVCATSVENGKVIDFEALTKYCSSFKGIVVSAVMMTAVPLGLVLNPGEAMDVCEWRVSLRHSSHKCSREVGGSGRDR
ncbi:hypothetical protein TNCV_2870781 [Trichonephila clavipes]|nr:hypothetical protein TNCV_2870781 [Trichonephila clavipes]